MAIKVGNLINASIQYNSEEEQERRLQSYQENGAVLSSWNHEYASDEDRKKYLQAVRGFDADTRYLQSKGYLDNDSARNNRAYMEYTVRDLNHPTYKSYDQWGQATGDPTYLSGLQSQLSDLQSKLSAAQQKMATTGNMDVYYKELQPLQNEISGVQKKIKNTQINVPDAEYEYYAGRTVEQLKADKAAIEQSEHDKWADIAPEEHIPFIIRPEDTREKLSMIDELIGQKEHEEKYAEYQSRMQDADFDGSYDPTNEDVFYQMMNGTRDRQDLGEQIYWTEGQFDELTDEERQIYNSIYKNEGRDQAFAYYQFVLRDLNARNRAKDEELMRRIAQEDPAGASALSVLYKMASPQAAIYQIVSAFSDEGIDQNSVYNFSSYAPTAIRNQVSRDLQYNEGETAAWLYQVGMSVADNVAQMAVTGGTQTAILALMSSNVFADSVVQMKDEGKSDFEIISTSTVRALIEYATEKIGLDEVFKVGQSGSFKEMLMNTLRATVAEGGEEVLSDVSNLFYDLADSFLSAKKSDYQKELERYRALGFTDSEAIGMIVTDWMKDTGLDFLSGALSGFVLSGTQASAAIAGGNVQSKAIEFAKQSFDETTNIGLSLDSDSLAYKYADLGKKYENPIMQGIQKLTQFTLNDIQTAKEASQYKTEVMDALRAASYEDLESVFYEKFDSAKSVAQQAATAVAFNEILKEREVEQIIKTNPTIETASEAEIGTLLRLSDPTVRTNSGEIVRLDNVQFSNAELRAAYNNAAKLGRTSDANDYISEFRSSNLPASVFDRVWNAAFEVGMKKGYDGSNADRMIEQLKSNSDIAAAIEVYGADVTNSILDIARRDGYDSLTRVTEGMKSMVMEMAKSFDDAPEVVFVDNLTDENGDLVNGEYKDGKIYISTTANDPATSVFCHEFTHYLETKKPDVWQQYKEKVLNKLYENKQTFKAIQERVEKAYGSDVETGISEIVAIASENFLIDSEFVDSLKENRGLFGRIRNSIMNRYNQIRPDVVRESVMFMTMEDQNFFTKLRELWIDMADQKDADRTDLEEMREEILPEKYSKGFTREVIDLSDDSELSKIVGDSLGNARYSTIRRYILDVLGDQPLTLSDGTKAIVDGGDARHLSSGALTKKTAEISEIKRIVETARLVADEDADHPKFNYFKYYEALVSYKGDTFPVYLNVGREKNTNAYHVYDITQKLRDTAHRINDVERAQGLRSGNGISSKSNIADSGEKINYSRSFDSNGRELTPQQAEYFANSKVRDETGDLLVVYHGTVREFYTFDREFANPEGNMGSGYYFTNNEYDAEQNYASEDGADLTSKIEHEADMLEGSDDYEDMTHEEIVEELRKKYIVEPVMMEAYLNITNPVYVGSNETYLFSDPSEDIDPDDYEDEDEYYEALDEAAFDLVEEVMDSLPWGYEPYFDKIRMVLIDATVDGGITLENLKRELEYDYIEDDQGRMAGSEVARLIVEALGYDGIIDDSASQKFRGMGLANDTTHYIAFESNQAKLTSNDNPTMNQDVRYSRSFESTPEQDVELLRQVSDVLSGIDVSKVKLTDDQVLKIAKRVKRNLKSEYSTEALAENLKRAFAYWTENKNVNFNALTQIMAEIMLPVVDEMYDYSGDSRKRLLLRNKTFIISQATAERLGSLNELNQSLLKYGVAFTTNENYKPADRRVVTDGEVKYVPSTRQVLRLVDNWTNNEFSGVADELSLDTSISSELDMVDAMVDFLQTEKKNARRQAIPEEFRETYAYNLALKAYEEFVAESRVSLKDVHQRANYLADKEADRIISDIRSTYINQYLNMMAEGEELIQAEKDKIKERANKAHYFDMLKREMKRFERLATRPTKNKHIDFNYMKYIGAIGSLVDLRSNRRISAANNALLELAEEYKRLSSIGMYQNGEYDPTIENMIYETGQLINGRAIRDLSSSEIKRVYDAIRAFIHAATQLNNFIDLEEARDINDAGEQSITDIESAKGTGTSRIGAIGDWWVTTSLNPLREIDRIIDYHNDDPFHLLMNKLVKGEIKIQQYKMEMSQIFKDMDRRQQTTDDEKERAKEYRKRYDKMNDTFVEAKLGGEVREITEAQKLALIMHARNKDNLTHILYGGVLLPDNTLYKRGNYAQAYARGEVVIPTEIELENLTKNLDDFEKWFLNRCIYYFEVYSRDLINRTSLKLEGFARAEVENYYPIRVADNYVNAKTYDIGTGAESSGESLHSGMLMARVKSKLPIYLNSITQDLLRSQNFVSRYAGLSIPLRDFNRLYHLKLDNGTEAGRPVREVIEKKWGTNATKYIDEVLKDLTNGRDVSTKVFDKAMDTIRAKSAQAVLTLNPSVSIKQAASYPTAIAELDYKSVMRALVNPEGNSFLLKRADQELIAKYTPLLWSRMAGMSTQEIAELSMDRNKNVIDKSLDKLPFLTDWIRKVDVATVGRLWYATQYWVDDHYKNVEKGSDQYYRIVADKFEDVVTKTQPNYTVMTRPDILRSKNSLVKAVMMFKTQPLQNFGILYDSTARLNAKRRQYIEAKGTAGEAAALAEYRAAGSQFARSLTSQLLQTAVFTGMTFLANTLILHRWDKYKDDELNEVTVASALEQVMWDYLDSLFGNAVIVDWAEDFASYFVRKFALGEDPQLYGISVFGIDNLNELSDLVQNIADKAQKGDTDKALSYAKTFAEDVAQLFGIPAANVEKLVKSVWEYTLDFSEGRKITDLSGTTARNYWTRIKAAYDRGENIDEMFDDMVDNVGADKVKNFFRTDDESGIMEWASEMYTSGTDAQKKMVEDWLDELYTGDNKETSIRNRKRAFYDYLGMDMPLELKANSEKTDEDFRQEFTNLSDRVSEKFNAWLQSGTVEDLPIKKGDSICSEQMAWLYQNSTDKEAVKRFAVQVLGYSEKAINRTASEWLAKDLTQYK